MRFRDLPKRDPWRAPPAKTRQLVRQIRREFDAGEAALQREEVRAAKRKERGIAGGSRARQFSPIDFSIEAVRKAVEGVLRVKAGMRSRTGFIKCARRLYNGLSIDRSWRSYPFMRGVTVIDPNTGVGRIVL